MPDGAVLVAGATGHVGSNLLPALVRTGRSVRALSRGEQQDADGVEWVVGDVAQRESLDAALEGVEAAYYLVHGLADTDDLEEVEHDGAQTFAAAANAAGVGRLVYLGGLAHGEDLSPHLRTRQEVGEILRTEGPLTVEFRASIVIGEGSASFELIRTLVDTLPVLVLPDWVETRAQPIAVDDVVAYLVEALELEFDGPSVFEIGGADTVTYAELIQAYGDTVGKARPTMTLPALPLPVPDVVSSLAPEQARVWLKLVEGLRYDSTVRDPAAEKVFSVEPRGFREALADAVGAAEPS